MFFCVPGIRHLVLSIISVHQILQHRTRLKYSDLFPIGELVRHGGDSSIGVNFQEPLLLLLII